MTTVLIDADGLAYAAAARVESKFDWGDTGRTREGDPDKAKAEFNKWIGEIKDAAHADKVVVVLSCEDRKYFRYEVLPSYKENRTSGEKPLVLPEVLAWLRTDKPYRLYDKPNLEADDTVGILATHPTLIPGDKIVCSPDKDLKQIPGVHLNPSKLELGLTNIREYEADRFFYSQVLSGDPCDGYKGCPGIGPVKAKKVLDLAEGVWLLANCGQTYHPFYWHAIIAAYEAKGLDEAHALTQARVARILRHSDYDYSNKRPILWNPTPPLTT